jgi:uncharacterized protein YtpQ (UPF0354 family)
MIMKRLLQVILAALGLCSGCSKNPVMSPEQFTEEFVAALRTSYPSVKVEVLKVLELRVGDADANGFTSFLYNAYDAYKQDPASKIEIIQRYIAAAVETAGETSDTIDPNRIVPVIKDHPWLEEVRQVMLSRGAKTVLEQVYEDFNADLIILYAEDSPKNIHYLTPKNLDDAKIERKDLRQLACQNLKRLIPKIECHGANGLYMVTAGGDYEASLLLLDSIWSDGQMKVQGDIVVAIPTRDLLLVTGSQDQEGIAKVKQMVQKAYNEGSYRLTQKLFVYRNGSFQEF